MKECYNTGEEILCGTDIYLNSCPVNTATSFHAHNFIEIAYVAQGKGIHVIGSREYSCMQGDIYILNYDVPHQFIPMEGCCMLVNNCIFKPGFLDCSLVNSRNFSDITGHYLLRQMISDDFEYNMNVSLPAKDMVIVGGLYDKMLTEFATREDGYVEILRAYLIELLVTLFRVLKKNIQNDTHRFKDDNVVFRNIISYIETNFCKDIKLEELSMQAFFSPVHFSRLFKEHTGMTVKEYIQKSRIDEACHLLIHTDKKVTDIAAEVGYHDGKHFNILFKRLTGKTPSGYRKSPV